MIAEEKVIVMVLDKPRIHGGRHPPRSRPSCESWTKRECRNPCESGIRYDGSERRKGLVAVVVVVMKAVIGGGGGGGNGGSCRTRDPRRAMSTFVASRESWTYGERNIPVNSVICCDGGECKKGPVVVVVMEAVDGVGGSGRGGGSS